MATVSSAEQIDATAPAQMQPWPRGIAVYGLGPKRLFDITTVLLMAPLALMIVAIAVMLTRRDGGRGLFGHQRIGQAGRSFTCWKIRTMVVDADAVFARVLAENPQAADEWLRTQKLRNDPRVTRLGGFLRRTSLDELPQLWNVLKGEMSLIGPRPFTPEQREAYESQGAGQAYYQLRPGITGLWQVGPRNSCAFAERVLYDRLYLQQLGLLSDIAILWRTVGVVLGARGH